MIDVEDALARNGGLLALLPLLLRGPLLRLLLGPRMLLLLGRGLRRRFARRMSAPVCDPIGSPAPDAFCGSPGSGTSSPESFSTSTIRPCASSGGCTCC
ncbi:MAG: hypothetical protein E6J85_16805 [Deltaproteobacteria bacterium]|nr:MAG: hypothetical protein E6J85_16805 [Deltaproteobacteria bacterium]